MKSNLCNVIIDAFWGSSGKGKIATWLADQFHVNYASSSNMPNAGHTVVFDDDRKFVFHSLPSATALWARDGVGPTAYLSASSGIDIHQFADEVEATGCGKVLVHDRAFIVSLAHKLHEQSSPGLGGIASTKQGSAAALVDKIMRREEAVIDFNVSSHNLPCDGYFSGDHIFQILDKEPCVWLHECSQGFALSIDHGSHYPQCTSRNITTSTALSELGLPPKMIGDVYLNVRTIPIRVGNTADGYSGDFYEDCEELTWQQVADNCGMPSDEAQLLLQRELTTVTKRLRRASSFSMLGLKRAVEMNGTDHIILNFVQYIDWQDYGKRGRGFEMLSPKTRAFVKQIEVETGVPVVAVGTGPKHSDMVVDTWSFPKLGAGGES